MSLGEIIESLADKEHERWSHWMQYLFSKCTPQEDGSMVIPAALVKHWKRQIDTPYAELSDNEKQSDRNQVFKMLTTEQLQRLIKPGLYTWNDSGQAVSVSASHLVQCGRCGAWYNPFPIPDNGAIMHSCVGSDRV